MSGQVHAPTTLHRGQSARYPLDRRLRGPQIQSVYSGEKKHSCRCPDQNPQSINWLSYPAHLWPMHPLQRGCKNRGSFAREWPQAAADPRRTHKA